MKQGTLKISENGMAQESAAGRFIRELAHPLNASLFLFWTAFVYIWTKGWADQELFDPTWWFDALGHATYGLGGALVLFYLFRRYAARGIFNFAGRFFLSAIVIAVIAVIGVLWEGLELAWDLKIQPDYFAWIAKAQKNSIDTTLDILVNTAFAIFAAVLASFYDSLYRRMYPNEIEAAEIEEMRAKIEHFSRDLRMRRTENLRNASKDILPKILDIARLLRRAKRTNDPHV